MAAAETDPRAPAVLARLTEVLATELPGHEVALGAVRRISDRSAVVLARLDWRAVALKLYTTHDAPAVVRAQADEYARIAGHMSAGPHQVPPLLHSFPEAGLAVFASAPGRPFGAVLRAAGPARRAALIEMAGRWLAQYQAPRKRPARFAAKHWLNRARGLNLAGLDTADQALAGAVLARMEALVPEAQSLPITQAATHGDFVSFNMLFDGETLYGVDIQGTSWQAPENEVARFLAWEAVHTAPNDTPRRYGLDSADLAAMRASGVLDGTADGPVLPLLVGFHLLHRFTTNAHRRRIADNARAALEAYRAEG